jgi:hypothetical protein
MKYKIITLLLILFIGMTTKIFSQDTTSNLKNSNSVGKYGEIGTVANLNPFSLKENNQARLSYLVDYKKDTLYTLLIATYNSSLGGTNMSSPGATLQFSSDTLSLGKIKNHVKDAYYKEQQLPTPININNSIFIVMKMKKDLTISIVNKAGIFPTSVTLSKKDINKLFGDKLLE